MPEYSLDTINSCKQQFMLLILTKNRHHSVIELLAKTKI